MNLHIRTIHTHCACSHTSIPLRRPQTERQLAILSASCLQGQLVLEQSDHHSRDRLAGAAGVVSLDPAALMSSMGRF